MIVKVQDNAGNNIAKTKFWIDGEPTGGVVEEASVVDSGGTGTPGQYAMQERMCYGGCTIKFAFQLEMGDTGFKIKRKIPRATRSSLMNCGFGERFTKT